MIKKKKKLNVCIGFDISSSTVGISYFYILENKIIKINYFYYKPNNKDQNDLEKIFNLYNYIEEILNKIKKEAIDFCYNKYNFEINVFVEEFIMFMKGRSSARTITLLSVYNRTVCLSVYKTLNIYPYLYSILTIRSILKNLNNQKEKIEKEKVPEVLEIIINKFWKLKKEKWKFRWLTNRNNKPIVECYDMADAIAVVVCGAIKNQLLKEKKLNEKRRSL